MALNFFAYFKGVDERLHTFVDYLLKMRMSDGAWNCEYRHGARQSEGHSLR